MKIETNVPSTAGVAGKDKLPSRQAKAETRSQKAGPADAVSLTPLSSQLQALDNAVRSAPVVDGDRVEAIKQAIREGHFSVNPEKIADQLIATVQELIQLDHKA